MAHQELRRGKFYTGRSGVGLFIDVNPLRRDIHPGRHATLVERSMRTNNARAVDRLVFVAVEAQDTCKCIYNSGT